MVRPVKQKKTWPYKKALMSPVLTQRMEAFPDQLFSMKMTHAESVLALPQWLHHQLLSYDKLRDPGLRQFSINFNVH